ncbi:GNAT family N-acetyltransferase [Streptomyces asoensis]|uniref:GNAT family N-acetyltransferase n=1 Tax=Streptomyces asoensis TaxID=249586 RepID=A0A6M4WRP1_9ACTN|nr:GNAT family N-acetyltransferase [Streptomyces asoensis]QJS98952.1 GNAT family N-acetyltransferase [Streptomyces asoensis]QJT06517.1 GNAT family N-acetyltransferase [Streptomyces asoensis]
MTDQHEVVIVRRPGQGPPADRLAELLAAYHLRTQAEKGEAVADADALPDRYRTEISDPRAAFADDTVLMALSGGTAVGCLVLTAPADGHSEIKRLWTDPAFRSRGIASGLIGAALAHAAENGVGTVRLSVWKWRTSAIALYERLGFTTAESWETRDQLLCMERAV